jgi:hypothetical protein
MTSYLEMIQDALITLADRKGSSRPGLWKCVSAKYPEADYKQYLIRLKKLSHDGKEIVSNKHRFKLNPDYKKKLIKALEKGESTKKVMKTKATMKKSKK